MVTSFVLILNAFFHVSHFLCIQIDCVVKLTGMPDLSMSFMNPRMFDDTSFHPCVRFKRWEVREDLLYLLAVNLRFILLNGT